MTHDPNCATQDLRTTDALHAVFRFLRVLRYRKVYVMTAVLVAGLLGAVYYLTATRIYEATAALLVTQTGSEVWNTSMTANQSNEVLLPTYERLLSSDVVLEGALSQLQKLPPELRIDFVSLPKDECIAALRKKLSARAVRRTNLIELRYRSRSARAAEAVVGAVVRSYLDFMDKNHRDVTVELVTLFDKERHDVETRLLKKQDELLDVKSRVSYLGLREGGNIVHPAVQRVVHLNNTLVEVQEQRLQLEAALSAIRVAERNGTDLRRQLLAFEPVVGRELVMSALGLQPQLIEGVTIVERKWMDDRAKLDTLLAHYGPRHPEVQRLGRSVEFSEQYLKNHNLDLNNRLDDTPYGSLAPTLVAMVEQRLAATKAHENELVQQYSVLEAEAVQLNNRMAELAIVESELERLRRMHETLLNRTETIDMRRDRADVRVAVVGEPTASDKPVSPRLSLVAVLCLLGGLGSGSAVVYVLDRLDDRFRSPEEIKEQLGVPVLAIIRKLPAIEGTGANLVQVHVAPESVESEAFRTLRTTLAFSGEQTDRIAITSSEPGDGKTTVLTNLAVAYAQTGRKTLLIDADMRRPGLSKLFGMRGEAGLSDLLRAAEPVAAASAELVRETGVENLHFLPAGARPPDPLELLSRPRMSDLIGWAEGVYDQVLIDCPPTLAASDAAMIGRLTDCLMLVVQPEKNHRRTVLRSVDGLLSMKIKLAGVVINRVGGEDQGGYYGSLAGYGYGFETGYGYRSEEDASDGEQESDDEDDGQQIVGRQEVPSRRAA
jgi:succinoglycan biosynthesis transport protein ExoP